MMKNSIPEIDVNKLLGREPIVIETQEIETKHSGKNILVTGGAGSIGSELVYQICLLDPCKVVILDQGETSLHNLILKLNRLLPNANIEYVLGDISDRERVKKIFIKNRFDIVYHAAAYKHVPIIEKNPEEGVRVNILGTKNILELAFEYDVDKFVMISTDKAVKPTSIMGATKRVAELLLQVFQNKDNNRTQFIITRFGNVLASNGSVLFRFKEQIEKREPITITHPDVTRYFMTISEACKLVLQAGAMGRGGEVCVFDMGKPIKILDLAQRMCNLYNVEIDKDIRVVFTGLREGDKLYEELWDNYAEVKPSYHKKMLSYRELPFDYHQFYIKVDELIAKARKVEGKEVVRLLKLILPEFKPYQNGI